MPDKISFRIVPWHNAAIFIKVYEDLYSNDIERMKLAYDTISVWETRCHPTLPTAIEATFVLAGAVIQDIFWSNNATLVHYNDLRAIYSSAITRFVNLSVEVHKNDEGCRHTSGIAKSIGIPPFIVTIRNECSHGSRPSLPALRSAVHSALEYLRVSYWQKEVVRVNNLLKQPEDEEQLCTLFKSYMEFNKNELVSKETIYIEDDNGKKVINPEYFGIMMNLKHTLKTNRRFFVNVLVKNGIFIPTDEDFKDLVSEEEYALFNVNFCDDDDDEEEEDDYDEDEEESDSMDTDDCFRQLDPERRKSEKNNFPDLPENHKSLWIPIIEMLNKYDAVPLFMETLLRSLGDKTVIGQKLIIAWVLRILQIHINDEYNVVKGCYLRKIFRKKGIVANWNSMLFSALVNPCKYTPLVLIKILPRLPLNKAASYRLVNLMSIKLGVHIKFQDGRRENSLTYKKFHTLKDLKQVLEHQRNLREKPSNGSVWTPCPDRYHKLWTIGCIISPIQKEEKEKDDQIEIIVENASEQTNFVERFLPSNKNDDYDDDDDDETCKFSEEPSFKKIIQEVERKRSLLYKRSG